MTLDFGVRDYLIKCGTNPDDGSDELDRDLCVIARAADGRQWVHDYSFHDRELRYCDEERCHFWGYRALVQAEDGKWVSPADGEVEALRARIEKAYASGYKLDPQHWVEVDPAYGSDAYQALDSECYFRNRDVMEAHDAGEISQREAALLMIR